MTPFQEFRLWARRAPNAERNAALLVAVVVLAAATWVFVPTSSTGSNASLGQGAPAAPGAAAPGVGPAAPVVPGPLSSVGPSLLPGQSAPPAQPGSVDPVTGQTTGPTPGVPGATNTPRQNGANPCLASDAKGVSAQQIKIAVIRTSIAGPVANSAFGISTPAEQTKMYQAVIDNLNASGGVACRKLVPTYYNGNPTDQSQLRQMCLDIAASGAFAVLDTGAYAQYPLIDCYAQHKIPYFGAYLIARGLQKKYYPYLFDFNLLDDVYRDAIFGLRDRGFWTAAKGFKKLGFIYRDCNLDVINAMKSQLNQAGVPNSSIVTYNVGCPTALASPSDLQQAVLKFKQAGVNTVTTAYFLGDFAGFTNAANQQNFKPRYGIADDAVLALSYGSMAPNAKNLDGAVAISPTRDGEERTAGTVPSAGTRRCDAILKKAGLGPTYTLPNIAGNACDNVWMFAAAVANSGTIRPTTLAAGLQASTVDFSYPQGPTDFSKAGTTTGGQFWRTVGFQVGCKCWRLLETGFHRSYA